MDASFRDGIIVFVAALALSGCDNPGQRAEEQYRIVSGTGVSPEEECAAAAKVADAWLTQGKETQYRQWKQIKDMACMNAELCRTIIGGCSPTSPKP